VQLLVVLFMLLVRLPPKQMVWWVLAGLHWGTSVTRQAFPLLLLLLRTAVGARGPAGRPSLLLPVLALLVVVVVGVHWFISRAQVPA
jgi:hypothetical protein